MLIIFFTNVHIYRYIYNEDILLISLQNIHYLMSYGQICIINILKHA